MSESRKTICSYTLDKNPNGSSVTDPEFLGRGAPTPDGVQEAISWQKFCTKLHENERNWTEGVRL